MHQQATSTRDMTHGSIAGKIFLFSLPLMLGNLFQMLYNTVDVWVVGNYVGTQALAAVGATTMIVNMLVFFFNGFSIGAGVLIGHHFGAGNLDKLHQAVETTMAMTFLFSLVFTVLGIFGVEPMLRFMSTPEDVFESASVYLRIYIAGISGLLIYNMGSGILRAVGNTLYPLLFLILTSVLNIVLDMSFVVGLHMGIAGVAYATIIAQFVSAGLILAMLTCSRDIYRMTWNDLRLDMGVLKKIVAYGLPTAIQSVITAFSNVFVQSYINWFGSGCMAGWSCYNKLDQFIMLPIQSMSMASTTFVSQNIGAGQEKRAQRGTGVSIALALSVTSLVAIALFAFAEQAIGFFTSDAQVVLYGARFVHWNVFFMLANCVDHVLAGALRGRGDAQGPMIIMLSTYVGVRQCYLFVMTRFVANTPVLVGLGYPVGWMTCLVVEVSYYFLRWGGKRGTLGSHPAKRG